MKDDVEPVRRDGDRGGGEGDFKLFDIWGVL